MRVFVYILFFLLAACTTLHPIQLSPQEAKKHLTTGDVVRISTQDETRITFEVVEVTDEAVVGIHEKIPFQDIVKIEKEELSTAKTNLPGEMTIFSFYGTLVIVSIGLLLLTAL